MLLTCNTSKNVMLNPIITSNPRQHLQLCSHVNHVRKHGLKGAKACHLMTLTDKNLKPENKYRNTLAWRNACILIMQDIKVHVLTTTTFSQPQYCLGK